MAVTDMPLHLARDVLEWLDPWGKDLPRAALASKGWRCAAQSLRFACRYATAPNAASPRSKRRLSSLSVPVSVSEDSELCSWCGTVTDAHAGCCTVLRVLIRDSSATVGRNVLVQAAADWTLQRLAEAGGRLECRAGGGWRALLRVQPDGGAPERNSWVESTSALRDVGICDGSVVTFSLFCHPPPQPGAHSTPAHLM
eukprot:TRINITY_DN46932_c0_g1_i1.p2 TRINITY_DN46932_c0_g1~~TRINITY_DN46932_c0_g1_i1.p2  ORF type:complete len:198 (+),score=37.56 TRINITY_DN46932_c0_g1_i1:95-688(+)